jgi:hypothetical protein
LLLACTFAVLPNFFLPNRMAHTQKAYHLQSVNPREMMGPASTTEWLFWM